MRPGALRALLSRGPIRWRTYVGLDISERGDRAPAAHDPGRRVSRRGSLRVGRSRRPDVRPHAEPRGAASDSGRRRDGEGAGEPGAPARSGRRAAGHGGPAATDGAAVRLPSVIAAARSGNDAIASAGLRLAAGAADVLLAAGRRAAQQVPALRADAARPGRAVRASTARPSRSVCRSRHRPASIPACGC